jgi:hypothetical protein
LTNVFTEINGSFVPSSAGGRVTGPNATIASATVANGGTSGTYAIGNVLTVVGGTGTAATFTVATVNAGQILTVNLTTAGSYSIPPTNSVAVTGGGGSGATLNLVINSQTAFTLTSGQSFSNVPADLSMTSGMFNAPNGTAATLAVDGGTAYPLVFHWNTAANAGDVQNTYAYTLVFNLTVGAWELCNLSDGSGGLLQQVYTWLTSNKATCVSPSFGNGIKLICYEGGQTFVDFTGTDTNIIDLYSQANRDNRIYAAYLNLLNHSQTTGATDFCHFTLIGIQTKYGFWGAMENVIQTPNPPKYQALLDFISPPQAPQTQFAPIKSLAGRHHGNVIRTMKVVG